MKIGVYEAKAHLSELIDKAEAGEEVVITRHGRPVAKLIGAAAKPERRKLGQLKGQIIIRDEFYAPLPDDLLDAFEGKR